MVGIRVGVGKVSINTVPMATNQDIVSIEKIDENIIYKPYLVYFIKSSNDILNALKRGATIQGISIEVLKSLQIPLPPMETQKQIAKTLDTVTELLALHKQQLTELDHLIKSVFYDMFGDPVVNEKGWVIKSLEELCHKITDGTHHSPENLKVGEYKYITAKNINRDGFDFSELTYVSEEVHKQIYSRCNPEYGDILYIKDGVTTGIAQINTLTEEFSMLSSVALLKHNRELINGYFLRDILNNDNMYVHIRENMGGAAITRLTLNKIKQIKIPVPPIELQNQFADIVAKIEEQKKLVKKAIDETQTLFDSLMSEYFDD